MANKVEQSENTQAPRDAFEDPRPDRTLPEEVDFVVDLDGYEGPLDLLLILARDQKVDLKNISILQLAEQYLVFVEAARQLRLEIAADYLVMAAWLAYLKSRLLLPELEGSDEPTGEELAARLQHQLRRLEAMRAFAATGCHRDGPGRSGGGASVPGSPRPTRGVACRGSCCSRACSGSRAR